ncbi:predicted protein [Naegleria gruberi]|uniref:Predicted protein n=1 Tax=Naegleria gruberi TaxID=5762 RepID=D2VFF5_NAEGR|nr:uncharacterized protein NAEGRDRAFT_67608 [Naegleria gruberi]EFC44357.1 predicted protein [Naegleria gruberi]|eukprot:XP_002677101.1 predicted protein [Naegleria gruberi strain NEG-M]
MTKKKPQKKSSQSNNNSSVPSGSNNAGKQSLTEHEIQMVLLEEQEIDQLFSTMSLKRKPIAKDGACLFRAFSDLYYGTQIYHDRVRKSCIEYMKEHESFFKDFIFEMDFNSYIKFMSKATSWGSQLELEALASLYKVNITVYGVNGILTEHRGDPTLEAQDVKNQWSSDTSISDLIRQKKLEKVEPKKRKEIRLAYLYGSHYDSVYPANEFMNTIIVQDIIYDTFMDPFKNDLFQKKVGTYKNVEYDAWLDELEKMEKKSLQKVKELLFQNEKSYDLDDPREFPQLAKQSSNSISPPVASSSSTDSATPQDGSAENADSSVTVEEKPVNAWLTQEKPNWASVAITKPVETQPEAQPETQTNGTTPTINASTNNNNNGTTKSVISQSHSLTVKMETSTTQESSNNKKKAKGNHKSKKPKNTEISSNQQVKPNTKDDVSLTNDEVKQSPPVVNINNQNNSSQQQSVTISQQPPLVSQFSPLTGYPQQPFSPPQFMGQPGVFPNQPPFLVMMPPPGTYPMPQQNPNNGMILIPTNLVPPNFVPHYPMMPPMQHHANQIVPPPQQPVVVQNHQPVIPQVVTEPPKPVSAWSMPLQSNPTSNLTVSSVVNSQPVSTSTSSSTTPAQSTTSKSEPSTTQSGNKKNTRKKK